MDLTLGWLRGVAQALQKPRSQAFVTLALLIAAVLLISASSIDRDLRALIWSTQFMDAIVGFTIILVGLVFPLVYLALTQGEPRESDFSAKLRERLRHRATAIVIISTLFVTYGIFRNQAKLAADASLNDEVMELYSIEMESEEIRCIYHNYGNDDPDLCLSRLASSPGNWSKAIFYVEEAWYALSRSEEEFSEWGSNYSRSLVFWAEDLERDPTGIFGYYLVANSATPREAVEEMRASGVFPDEKPRRAWNHLCGRYAHVWRHLGTHRPTEYPHGKNGAALECLRQKGWLRS